MKKIPPIPLWVKLKARFLGRGILLVSKNEEEYEYLTIQRQYKDLPWVNPNQVYIDENDRRYTNGYYLGHAIIQSSSSRGSETE